MKADSCGDRWIFSVLFAAVMTFGMVANAFILVMIILMKRRSVFMHFLMILSAFDIAVSLTGPSRAFMQCAFEWNVRLLDNSLCVLYTFVSEFFVDVCNYLKVLLAVMQVVACFSKRVLLPNQVLWHFGAGANGVFVFCFLKNFAFSSFFTIEQVLITNSSDKVPSYACTINESRSSTLIWILSGAFMWAIPYCAITVCNVMLLLKIRSFTRQVAPIVMKSTTSHQTKQDSCIDAAPLSTISNQIAAIKPPVEIAIDGKVNWSTGNDNDNDNNNGGTRTRIHLDVPDRLAKANDNNDARNPYPKRFSFSLTANGNESAKEISSISGLCSDVFTESTGKARIKKQSVNGSQSTGFQILRNTSLQRAIVLSNFIFLLNYLPMIAYGLYALVNDFFHETHEFYVNFDKIIWQIAHMFRYLQHATECCFFVLLCTTSRTDFRKTLSCNGNKKLCSCRKRIAGENS